MDRNNAPKPIFDGGGGPNWGVLLLIAAVAGLAAYVGYNYWYDCFDVGVFKACGAVKRPF